MQKFTSAEDQANAKKVIDDLRNGNFEEIEKAADSSISSANLHDTLVKIAPRRATSAQPHVCSGDATTGDRAMLILTRRVGEKVLIGDDIEITVLGVTRGQVRVGICAPRSVPVHREEVYERIRRAESRDRVPLLSNPPSR